MIAWIQEHMKSLSMAATSIAFVLLLAIAALDRHEPEQADDFEECDDA